jgi:hypothetical protein
VNTTELAERLRCATDGLAPPPGFAETVLHGGRRRRARRRLTVAASVLAVVAVAGAATVVTLREDTPAPVADARLAEPTKGTLAGDQAFLDQAREAWAAGLPYGLEASKGYYDDVRGESHVYWAGDTPAGRAAVVLQQMYVHPTAEVLEAGLRTAEGLVAIDPVDGTLKLVSTRVIGRDEPGQADYYLFGPDDRTLLIVDEGAPLYWAMDGAFVQGDDGNQKFQYDWQRVEPEGGVVTVTVPDDAKARSAIASQGEDPPGPVAMGNSTYYQIPASVYLTLRLDDPTVRMRSSLLRWGGAMWEVGESLGQTQDTLDAKWGYQRHFFYQPDRAVSPWTIVVGLPGGRMIILKEQQYFMAEPRLVARTAPNATTETMDLIDGGVVDRDAVLPVRFQIPDGGGWIVADKGKDISYRTSPEAPWQKAGRDAALLPDGVTEVLTGDHYVRLQ